MLPLPSDIVYSTFFNCYHYHLILYSLLSLIVTTTIWYCIFYRYCIFLYMLPLPSDIVLLPSDIVYYISLYVTTTILPLWYCIFSLYVTTTIWYCIFYFLYMLPLPSDIVYSTFFICYHYHLILYILLSLIVTTTIWYCIFYFLYMLPLPSDIVYSTFFNCNHYLILYTTFFICYHYHQILYIILSLYVTTTIWYCIFYFL